MKTLTPLLIFMIITVGLLQAQTMEEQVVAYVDEFLLENKSIVAESELFDTRWETRDEMGKKSLFFKKNGRFKILNQGFQATSAKQTGKWYIYEAFVVLHIEKEKSPVYVLKNGNDILLVDSSQIDVLKQLLIDISYKNGELKPYSREEIFTFLNGFTLNE
ncbi:MAG: hypothetical protein ABJF11_15595 [Reichenbachiella sp.]|uniref:hypothetical protein n=1 Tax=Reichenbachiella sp. TaxID=2184521 RepID=UPI0032670298